MLAAKQAPATDITFCHFWKVRFSLLKDRQHTAIERDEVGMHPFPAECANVADGCMSCNGQNEPMAQCSLST